MDVLFLEDKLKVLQKLLSARLPMSLLYGDIKLPNPANRFPVSAWQDFLGKADGGTFGGNIIWTTATLPKKTDLVRQYVNDPAAWLFIGASLDAPLMISLASEDVVLFEDGLAPRILGPVAEFADNWLMGPHYKDTVPDVSDDEWWHLLQECGFA